MPQIAAKRCSGVHESAVINLKRIFVLDTNVLLHDSECLSVFNGSVVVIPLGVLEELDQFKSAKSELGLNARHVSRTLDELRAGGSLVDGVVLTTDHGTTLVKVMAFLPEMLSAEINLPIDVLDNKIILLAKQLVEQGNRVTFITKDINLRIKADAIGLEVEDYQRGVLPGAECYRGWRQLIVSADQVKRISSANLIEHIPADQMIYPNEFVAVSYDEAMPNYRLFRWLGTAFTEVVRSHDLWTFRDKNLQQHMALDLLLDDTVSLVFLLGPAGTGKTFLALLAGMHKVMEEKSFNKLLVARPLISLGADLGFLPGDIQEKLYQWMHPVYDNLEYIFNEMQRRGVSLEILRRATIPRPRRFSHHRVDEEIQYMHGSRVHTAVENLLRDGLLSLEAITYMRGRSIPNQFVFIDEVQNLTPHEVKTIISRAGSGTKVVLCGDPYQIDSPFLDFSSNGLTVSAEKLKNSPLVGTIFLTQSERSTLAKLAVDLL